MEVKEIVKELAPVLEKTIKEQVEEWTKEFNTTLEALQKDVAEVKTLSKKTKDWSVSEKREKIGKFFRAFIKGNFEEVKTLSEWVDADGGYLVPSEFHKEVIRVAEISWFARKYCSIFGMSTDSKDVTTLSTWATAYIVDEGAAVTASTPQFGRKILSAKKFAVLVKSTQELIDDNMTNEEVMTLVAKLAAEALAELEDAQVLTWSGAWSNMTWILVDASVNVVTMAATKTSFADVTYWNLLAVKNAVKAKYKKASKGKNVWAMSQDVFNHIESIVDTTWRPIMRESITAPDTFTMFGYPIELNEVCPDDSDDAVSTKFLAFGAFAFFAFGDRKQISTEVWYASGDFEKQIKSQLISERVAWINLIPTAFAVLKTAAA